MVSRAVLQDGLRCRADPPSGGPGLWPGGGASSRDRHCRTRKDPARPNTRRPQVVPTKSFLQSRSYKPDVLVLTPCAPVLVICTSLKRPQRALPQEVPIEVG